MDLMYAEISFAHAVIVAVVHVPEVELTEANQRAKFEIT